MPINVPFDQLDEYQAREVSIALSEFFERIGLKVFVILEL